MKTHNITKTNLMLILIKQRIFSWLHWHRWSEPRVVEKIRSPFHHHVLFITTRHCKTCFAVEVDRKIKLDKGTEQYYGISE